MSGRRLRRCFAGAALAVGAALGAIALLSGAEAATWMIPLLVGGLLLVLELASLARGLAPDATVERRAAEAALVGRGLAVPLLGAIGATTALLAAAVPAARHGPALGLVGAFAATAVVLLVSRLADGAPPPQE